jgi:hypothetical protein
MTDFDKPLHAGELTMVGLSLIAFVAVTLYAPQSEGPLQSPPSTRPSTVSRGILDLGGTTVTSDSTESKTIDLPTGTRVLVRPGTTVRHSALPGLSRGGVIEVKGEAAIEVTREQLVLEVISRAGRAMLYPGSHAVRCVDACVALEVTVARGFARIRADRTDEPAKTLSAGQWGRSFRDSATVVDAAAARAFPLSDSTLRKAP